METRKAIAVLVLMLAVSGVFIQLGCENSSVSTCQNITEYQESIHPVQPASPFMQAWNGFWSLWSVG